MSVQAVILSQHGVILQDRLLNEQERLQDRLQKALELRLHPKTCVDTTTVADKIMTMFDDMLQASSVQWLMQG